MESYTLQEQLPHDLLNIVISVEFIGKTMCVLILNIMICGLHYKYKPVGETFFQIQTDLQQYPFPEGVKRAFEDTYIHSYIHTFT